MHLVHPPAPQLHQRLRALLRRSLQKRHHHHRLPHQEIRLGPIHRLRLHQGQKGGSQAQRRLHGPATIILAKFEENCAQANRNSQKHLTEPSDSIPAARAPNEKAQIDALA